MSAPHIYHSALTLSPSTSIIRRLYGQLARPLGRIVRGLSLSWELAVATIYLGPPMSGRGRAPRVVWSPCSKFIAASKTESVEVLDAVTLNRLATFKHRPDYYHFSFSPDSRSLMLFTSSELVSWDVQTGGRLSEILPKDGEDFTSASSFTYSKDGKMVAVACTNKHSRYTEYNFYTFDLSSRSRLGPLPVPDGRFVSPIWTHDEYLRFAIIHPGSITIWEVDFTLKHPPMKVESFPIPDEDEYGYNFLFLPVLYRLAFILNKSIQVWDVKASKLLLKSEQVSNSYPRFSFSSDGHFFTSSTTDMLSSSPTTTWGEVQVWKETPAGYALHQQRPFLFDKKEEPLLSPNGRSIIFSLDGTISLWHTSDQTLSPPSPPTEEHDLQHQFLLAFSPDEKSAAFAQLHGNVVTILDLRSSDLRLTIDTGMQVECLGVVGDTAVVVGGRKIVTWNLLGGDCVVNASINDSVRVAMFDRSQLSRGFFRSLSPDLSRIAVTGQTIEPGGSGLGLEIRDVNTGTCLASTISDEFSSLWFTRDGREVWMTFRYSGMDPRYDGWEIIEGGVSGAMELRHLEETLYLSRTFLWDSSRGYKVADDGWVLSPTRKRLLWLPHRWRSDREEDRLWSGRFLGLSHRLSSGVVILEFLE